MLFVSKTFKPTVTKDIENTHIPARALALPHTECLYIKHDPKQRETPVMTDLDDVYSDKVMEYAADISLTDRLKNPDATARAHSKLCGSTIDVDINFDDNKITAFGQDVKACLLGQVAASIVARQIIGTSADELTEVSNSMDAMLKGGAPPPNGRWSDLAILEPVKDYPHRHASTLLVFTALKDAIQKAKHKG